MEVVCRIASATVQGDDTSAEGIRRYQNRINQHASLGFVLDPVAGFTAGAWTAGIDKKPVIQINNTGNPVAAARYDAALSMQRYKLGDTVFVKNYGPYLKAVHEKYQPKTSEGAFTPVGLTALTEVYKSDFTRHFRES